MLSLLKLLGSTSFAQILLIAISPILTRIYTPDIFGEFLIITSWSYIINAFALGRMDIAILTSKSDQEIIPPFNLGILFILLVTLTSTMTIGVAYTIFNINAFYFLIPVAVLSSASYQLLIALLLAKQNLNLVAKNKVKQSMTLASGQLLGGMISPTTYSLSLAQAISFLLTSIFTIAIWKSYLRKINPFPLLHKYKNYIVYDNISNFFQVVSNNLPPILITYILGGYIGGLYYMAYRVLITPVSIFSVSISQYIGSGFRQGQHNLVLWNQKNSYLLQMMLLIFCIPFILISTYIEPIFPIVFGTDWNDTSVLIQSFTSWIFLRLIYDSFVITLSLKQKSKIKMCMDVFIFIVTLVNILTLWQMDFNGVEFLKYFSYIHTIAFLVIFCALNYFSNFQFVKNSLLAIVCTLGIIFYPLISSTAISMLLIMFFLFLVTIFYKTRKRAL